MAHYKEQLEEAGRRHVLAQQKASTAEQRVRALQVQLQQERKKFNSSSNGFNTSGTSAATRAPSAREEREERGMVSELKSSLASVTADRHRLENQLSGQRAKVQSLVEQKRRAAATRLSSILLLRAHQALGPALRRWQAASLENFGELQRDGAPGGAAVDGTVLSVNGNGLLSGGADPRQSRIIGLQRELLDREAQLAQAHQASLQWREERSILKQELAESRAATETARAKVVDAAFAASAAAEKEGRVIIDKRDDEVRQLRTRLAAADKGWRETAGALDESERLLGEAETAGKALRRERDELRKRTNVAEAACEELDEARSSEHEASVATIAELEARVAREAEQGVIRKRDRPITMQREMEAMQNEVEGLKAALGEERKRFFLQQKRAADAETRMEALKGEVERSRNGNANRLQRALQPSPQPSPRHVPRVATERVHERVPHLDRFERGDRGAARGEQRAPGGSSASPLLGQGGFGPQSPRGGPASPRGGFGDRPPSPRGPPGGGGGAAGGGGGGGGGGARQGGGGGGPGGARQGSPARRAAAPLHEPERAARPKPERAPPRPPVPPLAAPQPRAAEERDLGES